MFSITSAILKIYLLALTNAITVDFDGYFDYPKKLTYNYEDKQAAADYLSLREGTSITEILEMQEQEQTQEETLIQVQQEPLEHQLRSYKTPKKDKELQGRFREQEKTKEVLRVAYKKKQAVNFDESDEPTTKHHKTEENATEDFDKEEDPSTVTEESEITEDTTETNIVTSAVTDEPRSIPYQIQYNVTMHTFTIQIMESGLKVFDEMKNKTSDVAIKKQLDMLAMSYEYKYKEFLDETYRQEIKTDLGKQKVILNAIEESDRLIKRLINNVVIEDTNNLREYTATIKHFQQEVRKETDHQFRNLCRDFSICRSADGFSKFLNDYLTIILRSDDTKIQEAIDSLTEVVITTDFKATFHKKTRKEIKKTISRVEKQDFDIQKAGLMVIKNIVANRNKPISVMPSDLATSRINSTIVFLDILDAFETKLLKSHANVLKWGNLKTNLDAWERGKRDGIEDIMRMFMGYIKTALEDMPTSMKDHVAESFSRVVRRD